MTSISDPRVWPAPPTAEPAVTLHRHVQESLAAATSIEAEHHHVAIESRLRALIETDDGATLAAIFDSAPSAAIYRHLWRALARAEAPSDRATMAVTVFALPLTIVAGRENADDEPATLPCVLRGAPEVAKLLRDHGALSGNEMFALADTLVAADAIEIHNMACLYAALKLRDGSLQAINEARALPPLPIIVDGRDAGVHLRFIVGAAVAASAVDLVADDNVGRWGLPLTRLLGRALAHESVTLLILPQAPKRLAVALQRGRAAQREVSAQLFASNAIRNFRASVGEPVAVISAHRAADTLTGGELRLSLSSVVDPRDAEGFRCPLYRADQSDEVADMLVTLLRDCRIAAVHVLPGVYPDRDPSTGSRLLFKADALADAPAYGATVQ